MQITFSPQDRRFAARLSTDLERRGLSVVLREAPDPGHAGVEVFDLPNVVLISRSAPCWSPATLEASLPALIEDVALPESISEIKYANFVVSYESGLNQLLRSIWPAISRAPIDHRGRQFAYAFKAASREQLPANMAPFVLLSEKWSFCAVIESAGDVTLAPQLTRHISALLKDTLGKTGLPGPRCLEPMLGWVNVFARAFRVDMKLPVDFPLGASIAALAEFEGVTEVGTVGSGGVLATHWRNPNEIELMSFYSASRLRVPRMDSANAVVSVRAPLGYLEPDKDATGWADCREVSFSARGDRIALATFRFPTNQDRLNQVGAHLAKTGDAAAAGVVLTNMFGSAVRDGLCLVGTRTDT